MKNILALFLVTVASVAQAGESVLTWAAPTQNCGGTPLTNLTGYSLTYGQARTELGLAPLSHTITGLTPGVWWFSLAAVKSTGERSEFITVTDTITPEEFVVAAPDVYTVVKRVDRFVMVKVGTVPMGTQCDATQRVNEMFVVPIAAVTWASVKADVVVAVCR